MTINFWETFIQLNKSDQINNLKNYYEIFDKYVNICIGLLVLLNGFNRHDFINYATEEFVEDTFAGDYINDMKNTINQTEIKNALKKVDLLINSTWKCMLMFTINY